MLLWNFGAIGSYISGNALEETLYQLGMCPPGVMSTVLSGKHCNRCQTLHKTFPIATERLYVQLMRPKSWTWLVLLDMKNLVRLDLLSL